jgi:hypothetical protein
VSNGKEKHSNVPKITMSLHTKELFERSKKAISKLKKAFGKVD